MYPTGTLLKTDKPAIYIIDNHKLRHITNLASYISFGFHKKNYRKISDKELSHLNLGKPITNWQDLSPDLKLYIKEHLRREKLAADIIIVNYNSLSYLKGCLKSIYKNTDYPYNIIIIDNNSTDENREFLSRLNNITIICNQENKGCAAAWNQGIKKGINNYIVLLNPDTEVTADWLYPLVRTAAANQDIALLGTKHVNQNEAVIHAGVIKKNNKFIIRKHPRDNPDVYNKAEDVDRIHGACFMIKRELIKELGYFDERYFLYSEETDYCHTAKSKGYRIYYYPVKIYHYEKGTPIDQNDRQKIRLESVNKFKKKWGSK